MDNKEKSPEQELIESIGLMIEKGMESNTNIYTGVVKSVDGKRAVVTVNGQNQTAAIVNTNISNGHVVRVFVPDGNMSNAFVVGDVSNNVASSVRIQVGTYFGTGKYGFGNPNSLSFDFKPMFVYVVNNDKYGEGTSFFVQGCVNAFYMESQRISVSWSNNSVSWYQGNGASTQLNASGSTYYYFAIGM